MSDSPEQVISAARFYIDFAHIGKLAFSELSGISSRVTPAEYVYNTPTGDTVHTKQYGKTEPPTIRLSRALDQKGNGALMAWHAMARKGQPGARSDGTLTMLDASGNDATKVVYAIHHGWCSDLEIGQLRAGDASVVMIECQITCESIEVIGAG